MRKTHIIHQKQENEHGLPGSIIAMDIRSVNRLCSPKQTATVGIGALSAGIALSGVAGITQISALLALVLAEQEQTVFQRLREW